MKVISIKDLKPVPATKSDLYHQSGELLLPKGETLDAAMIDLLKQEGIKNVVALGEKDSSVEFRNRVRNRPVSVGELEKGSLVSTAVFDKDGNLLIDHGVRISESIITGIKRRNLDVIFVALSDEELKTHQVRQFRRVYGRHKRQKLVEPVEVEVKPSQILKGPSQASEEYLDNLVETATPVLRVERSLSPFHAVLRFRNELVGHTADEKSAFLSIHDEAVLLTEDMFKRMVKGGVIDGEGVASIGREIISAILYDAPLLVNVALLKTPPDYLKGHSIAVGILAANVGTALGYSKEQVFELSYGALLHDVGMLKVPSDILFKKEPLTPPERREIDKHPAYGLEILQKMRGIPRSVPLVAYQSHERLNGAGYPKRRRTMMIHDFAKIVAVCDAYEALTSERPHRPPLLPYKAIERIIIGGSKGLYDPAIIKALLQQVSLFPVGSWVELKGGEKAKVVASSREDYTRPVLSILINSKGEPQKPERISMTEHKDLQVVRAIDGSALNSDIMYGF